MSTIEAWGEIGKKYKIHPETLEYFRIQKERGARPYTELSVQEARETSLATSLYHCGEVDFRGSDREFKVPSGACEGGIPVTVYKDKICPPTAPILVYFHGGGMVVGSRKAYEVVCKTIARDTPCIVVSVEYRMAPEYKYPASFDDAELVTRWIVMNKALVGGSNDSRIGVGGDSAGGNLATSLCHYVNVDFQVQIYPMTDFRCIQPSFQEFANAPGLSQPLIDWFADLFFASKAQMTEARVSPLLQSDFSRLPPAIFIIAELDPLRDCGYAYRDKMESAGVHTECLTLEGVPHAYFHLLGAYKENCQRSTDAIVKFIRKFNR